MGERAATDPGVGQGRTTSSRTDRLRTAISLISGRRDQIVDHAAPSAHSTQPRPGRCRQCRRHDIGNGLAEAT